MTQIPVLDRLEEALVAAVTAEQRARQAEAVPVAAPRRRRRVRRVAAAAVGVAAAVTAVSVVGLPSGRDGTGTSPTPFGVAAAAAEVTVRHAGERIEIEIAHVAADPADIRRKLQEAGVPVEIMFLPASPSLEGKLTAEDVSANWRGRITYAYRRGDSLSADVATVSVPADVHDGHLTLFMGRRAQPGEQYASAAISAASPGEALHCVDIYGHVPLGRLLPQIAARHVTLHVRDDADHEVDPATVADRYVRDAIPWAPGEVLLWTSDRPAGGSPGAQALRRSSLSGCAG